MVKYKVVTGISHQTRMAKSGCLVKSKKLVILMLLFAFFQTLHQSGTIVPFFGVLKKSCDHLNIWPQNDLDDIRLFPKNTHGDNIANYDASGIPLGQRTLRTILLFMFHVRIS